MIHFIKTFAREETGALTVDWLVLTAAVVGLAVAAYTSIEDGAANLAADTETYIESREQY